MYKYLKNLNIKIFGKEYNNICVKYILSLLMRIFKASYIDIYMRKYSITNNY